MKVELEDRDARRQLTIVPFLMVAMIISIAFSAISIILIEDRIADIEQRLEVQAEPTVDPTEDEN